MKTPNIREAINQALSKYQVTIEELEEMYVCNICGAPIIDGLTWYHYFYVPQEVQLEIVKKWQKKYKGKFSIGWFSMPTDRKDSSFYNETIGDQTLINNRNELLKIWD